ncbi:ExbD/TolR family protein [Thiomicrorhabdus aquaedulcis]|uniref:ExbD/TolR family protein n=1 Tax=Thiomicrorhabdus aquaedulcis TaxID=2211106 RepID=UPI000FDA0F95|nr:biopolymer transporter ExbD [Thiomicrorhabdus aquaedulcis]
MKRFDTINVIPLIDVMLVLLAIVLTTASFIVKDNLKIDLPQTQSTQAYMPEEKPPISFHIDANNQLYLNEQPRSLADISDFLVSLDKQQPLILQVDKQANFGDFVALVDAIKQQQLTQLTILTKAAP